MKLKTIAIASIVSGSAISALPIWADQSSFAENLVEEYYSQFQKPGFLVDELMKFYSDDVLFTDPTFEIIAVGKSEVRKLYADLGTDRTAYKNIEWKIRTVISQGESIVIRGIWSGQFQECDFEVDFMTFWRLVDEKIAEQNDFFAAGSFDRQVGWNGTTATCNPG